LKQKVFGIGFHKTGTSSLAHALGALGYRVGGRVRIKVPSREFPTPDSVSRDSIFAYVAPLIAKYDAFQDNPWPLIYRQLAEYDSDAKFILTWRDPEKWFASFYRHFGDHQTPTRAFIYGAGILPSAHKSHYLDVYRSHNRAVQDYFADSPERLLVLRLEDIDWEPICAFLGHDVPDIPFPQANSANKRESQHLRNAMKQAERWAKGLVRR